MQNKKIAAPLGLWERLKKRIQRVARQTRPVPEPGVGSRATGWVEIFSETEIYGWVAQGERPSTVELYADKLKVAETSTFGEVNRSLPYPVAAFRFQLSDIWKYCGIETRLTVVANGLRLMIDGHGIARAPLKAGKSSLRDLRKKLAAGRVFNQFGKLQVSKAVDTKWRNDVLSLYRQLADDVRAVGGHELVVCYGTHLGAVRSNDFIGHDHDFDAAIVCRARSGEAARAEALELANALKAAGYGAKLKRSCVYYFRPERPDIFIDTFHLYFDRDGRLQFPFGVASADPFRLEDMRGIEKISLAGVEVAAIAPAEAFAAKIYGAGWRTPNPGFNWNRDRVERGQEGIFAVEEVEAFNGK